MSYQPDWDLDRLRGEKAEAMVRRMRSGILTGETEVKRDDGAFTYGNAYFEHECNRADGWQPSGIATTKATNWAHVFWPVTVVAPPWLLRIVLDQEGQHRECVIGTHPTKGKVIPVGRIIPALMEAAARPVYDEDAA